MQQYCNRNTSFSIVKKYNPNLFFNNFIKLDYSQVNEGFNKDVCLSKTTIERRVHAAVLLYYKCKRKNKLHESMSKATYVIDSKKIPASLKGLYEAQEGYS